MAGSSSTVNTFPPLISGSSIDFNNQKQLFGTSILASCVFSTSDSDPFFNPTAFSDFNGYAADGKLYANGVLQVFNTTSGWVNHTHADAGLLTGNPIVVGTTLNDNRVLLIHDNSTPDSINYFEYYATFNQSTGLATYYFDDSARRSLAHPRSGGTSQLVKLPDGKVVILGGGRGDGGGASGDQEVHIEVFEPITNTWSTYTSILPIQLRAFSVSLLSEDKILITGGLEGGGLSPTPSTNSYLFDAANDTITSLGFVTGRSYSVLAQLSATEILVIGGEDSTTYSNDTSQILQIDLTGNTISPWILALPTSRTHCAIERIGDQVYIIGGTDPTGSSSGSNIYTLDMSLLTIDSADLFNTDVVSSVTRPGTLQLPDGEILVAGFTVATVHSNKTYIYDPSINHISSFDTATLNNLRDSGILSIYNGSVLVFGPANNITYEKHSYFSTNSPKFSSWYNENSSEFRSSLREFPNYVLVLLTDVGLSIINQQDNYSMWMSFLCGDQLAYTNNFIPSNVASFTPYKVEYKQGRIAVTMVQDPGTVDILTPTVLTIDFINDRIFLEASA